MRTWTIALSALVAMLPGAALWAGEQPEVQEASSSPAAGDEATTAFPIGGSIGFATSMGRGTFNEGVEHQPLVNLNLSLRPVWRADQDLGISMALRLDVWSDVVENAHSDATERQQVFVSDVVLSGTWAGFGKLPDAGLSWDGSVALVFPTSVLSQHVSKLLGLRAGVTSTWEPLDWLNISYDVTVTGNINAYDSAVLDASDFSIAPRVRPGGAESVSDSLTATGEGVTAWALSHGAGVDFTMLPGFTGRIAWSLIHSWRAASIPKDRYSSAHAVGGVGRSDTMSGGLSLSYQLHEWVELTLGTVTEQAPKTADNASFRFPFWDTTNGTLNRQVVYLEATLSL